jgi:hypothetical protein
MKSHRLKRREKRLKPVADWPKCSVGAVIKLFSVAAGGDECVFLIVKPEGGMKLGKAISYRFTNQGRSVAYFPHHGGIRRIY